ncbi:MAG: biotin/lipoyl-binding protein, partial [Bacteroidaceae bacterium]|nr:biotin/lipoyl-binding protein [Bacteroidaceae bacterium]
MMKKMFYVMQLSFVISCLLLVGCNQAPTQMPAATYACLAVSNSDKTITSEYSATIKGRQDIAIMPQVGGTLTKLCVEEGQKVKKGQVMFIIDQVPYKAQYETAKANVEAATAAYETANLNYESRQELYKEN